MKIFNENNSRTKNEDIHICCDTREDFEAIQCLLSYAQLPLPDSDMLYALTESRKRIDKVISRIKKKAV